MTPPLNPQSSILNPATFGKVAVLFGGRSAEREVSLKSGAAVLAALHRSGVDAYPFDPAVQNLQALVDDGFDRAFLAPHGRLGERATGEGPLEGEAVLHPGGGVRPSPLGMDKW